MEHDWRYTHSCSGVPIDTCRRCGVDTTMMGAMGPCRPETPFSAMICDYSGLTPEAQKLADELLQGIQTHRRSG